MKTALITGASSGIGKHTALGFLKEGFAVTLAGRRKEALEQTVAEAGQLGENALVVPTDVRQPEAVTELFTQHKNRFGRLDVLFNNAGIGAPAIPLDEISYEQWKAVVDTNLTAVFLCTKEAVKIMKAQSPKGGRIINNGSISAHVPRPNSAPYTATKHAVTGLTRSTLLDYRKHNIACGQIDIGNAATPMAVPMQQGILQANGTIAVEPTMNIQQVVDAVLYMANLPLEANVPFMTVMATAMPYIGRG